MLLQIQNFTLRKPIHAHESNATKYIIVQLRGFQHETLNIEVKMSFNRLKTEEFIVTLMINTEHDKQE